MDFLALHFPEIFASKFPVNKNNLISSFSSIRIAHEEVEEVDSLLRAHAYSTRALAQQLSQRLDRKAYFKNCKHD